MKRLLTPFACALALCSTAPSAEPAAVEEPVLAQLQKLTDEFVAKDGFSDEDAITAAIFLMKKMKGDPATSRRLFTEVRPTKPGYVKVYVAYVHPRIYSPAYEFEFFRGDQKTTCRFISMTSASSRRQMDEGFTQQVAAVLKECQTVKPGKTTREELGKIFTTEGGISTPMEQTFVHRSCPYIKVRVEFTLTNPAKDPQPAEGMPQDKVSKISEPFLQWSVID